ncbi:MAG: hypothetical protein JSR65_10405 [Proteobacteria bacterium]|nr:hypothetical protein [Pseudomonadota bacterium]
MKRILLPALLSLFTLAGCGSDKTGVSDASDKAVEMRVYQVAPEDTSAVTDTLNKLLAAGEKAIGRATSPSPGQIVVLAPASLQGSIADTLKSIKPIAKAKPDALTAKPLQLSFWNVDAIPGKGADDPALTTLGEALQKVRQNLGDVHFQLNSRASGVSSLGQPVATTYTSGAGVSAHTGNLRYSLSPKPEGILLDIHLADMAPQAASSMTQYAEIQFSTAVIIALGQTIVLSDVPLLDASPKANGETPTKTVRLNIIRVEEASSK